MYPTHLTPNITSSWGHISTFKGVPFCTGFNFMGKKPWLPPNFQTKNQPFWSPKFGALGNPWWPFHRAVIKPCWSRRQWDDLGWSDVENPMVTFHSEHDPLKYTGIIHIYVTKNSRVYLCIYIYVYYIQYHTRETHDSADPEVADFQTS